MAVFICNIHIYAAVYMFFICIKGVNVLKSIRACEKYEGNRRIGADMALVLWLLMALIPFALGRGALCILYGNQPTQETDPADCVLTGGMIIIGLAEAAHLGACLLGRSFSDCVKLFAAGVIMCLVVTVIIGLVQRKRNLKKLQLHKAERERVKAIFVAGNMDKSSWVFLCFGVLVVAQLVIIYTMQSVYTDGDMTLETVNSFLATDAVYHVNPMTGNAYTLGIPMRLKILCLPTFYGILSEISGLSSEPVVWVMIPGFVLLGSYLAYSTVAKVLFPGKALKRAVFLVVIALLYSFGDYMYGVDGFGIMHSGFRGVTIRAAILIPYTVGLMLRKKYKLVVLCVLAEACMVWTFYGMGACAAVAVGMFVVDVVLRWTEKRYGRREDDLCKKS